jgi:hypothetical protein
MHKLVFVVSLLLLVSPIHSQQGDPKSDPARTATPPADPSRSATLSAEPQAPASEGNGSEQNRQPASTRPGHPLDPADVDVLTGKRDREMQAARRAAVPVMAGSYGEYGNYGDYYWMNGRVGGDWDIPLLPFPQITSPFFYSRHSPRGFGRGGFRGGR